MKITDSKVNNPKDTSNKAMQNVLVDTKESINKLIKTVDSNKISYNEFTERLLSVINESVNRIEAVDNSKAFQELTQPIIEQIGQLNREVAKVKQSFDSKKLEPNIKVNVDTDKLKNSIQEIPKSFQKMIQGIDVMERQELDKHLKEIVKLLKKISAGEWVSQGATIIGGGSSGGGLSLADLQTVVPDQAGTWGYSSGTNGTLVLSGGKRVLQITAIAQEASASLSINGGNTITLPYGSTDKVSSAITIEPKGNLVDPTIVFSAGVDSYFCEWVI